jgi:ABC-type multidrug transport system fused ATPase/permease subunit
MALLQNVYKIQKGQISIGDLDINYIDTNSLRNIISVVPQKIDLFAGNVIENIAVGDFNPNMEQILEICKSIGVLDFVENLPNGFETYLGENGASLSGGQKQRIAIARALYKNPEILILDEATSSLDSKSENYIQKTILSMRDKHKTVVIIAHRLSTIVNADKIIVLDKGLVVESGTHTDLYNQKGRYYELWQAQQPVFKA